jgi:hypothetical protein
MKCKSMLATLALLMTGGSVSAENCTIPTDDEVQAQTAKCLLSIDGRLLVNARCNFNVSPDGHATFLDAGKYYIEVNVDNGPKGNGMAMASWNRGTGRSDHLASLGPATWFERSGATCSRNRRFEMWCIRHSDLQVQRGRCLWLQTQRSEITF